MPILKIVYYPDPPLTDRARPVETFDAALARLVEDMLETMRAYEGVGLAAPQVGVRKRVFVFQPPESEPQCLVNPEILERDGREEGEEGCLSMPGIYAQVPRATRIRVRAQDVSGRESVFEAHDFRARVIQHEYDHLEGVLFPDRLDIITREQVLRDWALARETMSADAPGAENVR